MTPRTITAPGLMLLLLLPCLCMAQPAASATNSPITDETWPTPERLTAQVAEISRSSDIPFDKKEGRIAAAVRLATTAVLAQETDPVIQLELASKLATAASADPRYTAVIVNAILSTPAIANIEGAGEKIRAAAYQAAEPLKPTSPAPAMIGAGAVGASVAAQSASNSPSSPVNNGWSGNPFRENSAYRLSLDTSITHDDNVFLTDTDTVSDQIYSVIPGIDASFGQNSLLHGSGKFQLEFMRYGQDSAPDSRLTHASADLGYSDDRLTASANAAYNESFQNSRDTISLGSRALFETDTLSFDSNARVAVSPLTGFSLGAAYGRTSYDYVGLFDRTFYSIPFAVIYQATPKVGVSLGATYRAEDSDDYEGAGVQDWYYNLGANGAFTAKLSGSLSAGYRKRHGDNNLDESMFGFTAGLKLELSAKSNLSLSAKQDFETSAQGQSTENSSYTLGLSTAFSPQWSATARVSYQQIDYGTQIYGTSAGSTSFARNDDYWEGGITTSYLYTSWLSTAFGYTLRSNSSTLKQADFSNNLLTLTVNVSF